MRDAERSAASAAYASRFFVDARWFADRTGAQRNSGRPYIPPRGRTRQEGLMIMAGREERISRRLWSVACADPSRMNHLPNHLQIGNKRGRILICELKGKP